METTQQNPVDDGVTNDLLVVNELIYKIPPDLNIAQSRTQKMYRAGQNVYKYGASGQGPMVEIMVQSGLEYIDPSNSTIEFDIEFDMRTTYNLNWSEAYRAAKGTSAFDIVKEQLQNGPNVTKATSGTPAVTTYTSRGGLLGNDRNFSSVANACTRAGKWWLDGSMSLIDTIELIHSSGQSIQKIVEVGPLANITHQFKYNYDRQTLPSASHSQLNFANISHTIYSGLQAEMDGYQLIDPEISRQETNKPIFPNLTWTKHGATHSSTEDSTSGVTRAAQSFGFFLKFKNGAATVDPTSLNDLLEADDSMVTSTAQSASMVQSIVSNILDPTKNSPGSIAPVRAWAGDWLAGTSVTQRVRSHVVIPLSRIPGLFEIDQMLPPQLVSGLKIQLKMALPSQGLTYFYNTGINASRNNAGYAPQKNRYIAEGYDPLGVAYTKGTNAYSHPTSSDEAFHMGVTESELEGNRGSDTWSSFGAVAGASAETRALRSGLLRGSYMVGNQPYTTQQNFPSDLGVLSGRPGEIRQEDFYHDFVSGVISNCVLIADSYNLAPAIQRKLDAVAASGQMRVAYPNYTHIIPSVTESTYVNTSQTQIPISIATENALWAFLGFRPNQASSSYNANQMYTRFLPYIVDSYQARAGSYYYPADPIRVGQSGTWRDFLPFLKQQMLATGKLSKNYTGCIDVEQLLPPYFKMWVDSGKQCSKYMPTVYHLPCSTMCGLWVSLERSAVLQNSGMPLNQNRQLTFIVEGGLGKGAPGTTVNPFSTQSGVHGDSTPTLYKCDDAFLNDNLLAKIAQPITNPTQDVKQYVGYGGVSGTTGMHTDHYDVKTFLPPLTKIPGSDCIMSFPSSLYYNTGVQAVCYVASVGYLTILLNTIVKRE